MLEFFANISTMKNNDQSGFILMIIIMVAVAIAIIGFAFYRIITVNASNTASGSSIYLK